MGKQKDTNYLGHEELMDIGDITQIGSSGGYGIVHNNDTVRSLSAHLPVFKKHEKNLTDDFFKSLEVPFPQNQIRLVNFHIYGGPECFPAGSLVTLPDGTWKRIEEFGAYHGQTLDKPVQMIKKYLSEKTTTATHFHIYKDIPCYEIITNTGRRVECSFNQPFFRRILERKVGLKKIWKREKEWILAENLLVGDEIRISIGTPNTKKDYVILHPENLYHYKKAKEKNKDREYILDENLASLFGYAFGDGGINKHKNIPYEINMYINEEEQDLIPLLIDMLKKIGIKSSLSLRKPCDKTYIWRGKKVICKQTVTVLSIYGLKYAALFRFLEKISKERVPPVELLQSPKSVVAAFLRWYYEADGCCSSNTGRGRREIGLKSGSIETLCFVQLLLMGFGIQARIRINALGIRRKADIVKFANEIGFASKKKKKALQKLVETSTNRKFKDKHYETIKSIKKIGNRTVYDLTTKAHELVVNGFKAHNTGKSTIARAIGYHLKEFYSDKCQCIECQYLPDSIHHWDPTKSVIVISVDDPMGAAEEGGTQDARRGMGEDVELARAKFNAIRHIYKKKILRYRAEKYFGKPLPDDIVKAIELYHDNNERLLEYLPKAIAVVSAIIFIMWGPQLPTIDQTFHQNKMWNIYKGFSAMDEKRKNTLRSHLGPFWMQKLGEKEKAWRRKGVSDARSWSVVEDPYTNEKGWLYVKPTDNIFFPVDRGGRGFQQKIQIDTEKMDIWARYIYESRNSLMPPYDPFDKKENRIRSITNFLKDTLKSDKDPRTFDDLAAHHQLFLKNVLNRKVSQLDDRIIKYRYLSMNERKNVEILAQELIKLVEDENMTPSIKNARSIIHDLARRKLTSHSQLVDKPQNFKKIYDHFLYIWRNLHPDPKEKSSFAPSAVTDEHLIEHATVVTPEHTVEFSISEAEIIKSIISENSDYADRALIYMHSEGIGERDVLTNRQMYLISHNEKQRKQYGFSQAFKSEEAVKYAKRQFRGMMSYVLGRLFEDWLEQILIDGYFIPGVLEKIKTVRHSSYEQKGQPDFILTHDDDSITVLAAKCYASPRSETLEKEEIAPELRMHNNLLEDGKNARIAVVYCNIKIPHMLVVYTYSHTSDVPPNLTFPPSLSNHFHFRRES